MRYPDVFCKGATFEVLVDCLYYFLRLSGVQVWKTQRNKSDRTRLWAINVPCLLCGIFQMTSLLDNYNPRALGTAFVINLTIINVIVKICALTYNAKAVKAILQTIVLRTCSEITLTKCCPKERQLIHKYSRLTQKITIVVIMSFIIGDFVLYVLPYLLSLASARLWIVPNEYKIPGISADSHPGFDLHSYIVQYTVAYISVTYVSTDLLFLFCAMYIALQFDICVLYVIQLNDNEIPSDFRRVLELHTHVFEFCNLTSNLLEQIILADLISGLMYIVICITLYKEDPLYFLIVLFVCILQLLIFCYFGQIINNKAVDTANAIYFCDWLQFRRRSDRTNYLQLVKGSQVDLAIKPFRAFSLSLATFVQILKTSYSYNAFLQNVV